MNLHYLLRNDFNTSHNNKQNFNFPEPRAIQRLHFYARRRIPLQELPLLLSGQQPQPGIRSEGCRRVPQQTREPVYGNDLAEASGEPAALRGRRERDGHPAGILGSLEAQQSGQAPGAERQGGQGQNHEAETGD